ncbi:OmpA family protein [Thalassospira sp. MCCC 1A01428]|uniref:OmpA family protein n=1 Tax=Thalassospira sp. MCCC 1A01428 TaxID=1470575 RepID=UPI00143D769D|nr:OmpA family protein [Thalassospira sp. MCCC 1A01428]
MRKNCVRNTIAALCTTSLLAGCANQQAPSFLNVQPDQNGACQFNEAGYVIGGALLGAGLGLLVGGKNRGIATVAGGAAGALAGKGLQSYLTSRCEKLAAVQKELRETRMGIARVNVPTGSTWANPDASNSKTSEGLLVTVDNSGMFASGDDNLSPAANRDMHKIADTFRGTDRNILIVGHTDSTGSRALNLDLSQRRARTVGRIFEQEGVDKNRIFYKGAGEDQPIASNTTETGKAQNRRVQIIELETREAIMAFANQTETDPTLPERVKVNQAPADVDEPITAPAPPKKSTSPQKTTPKAQSTPPASQEAMTKPGYQVAKSGHGIDFGGKPAETMPNTLSGKAGLPDKEDEGVLSSLWPLGSAKASETTLPTNIACIEDTYRPVGAVMSLANDRPVHETADYLPALYSTSWYDTVNNHLVGLTKVAVLQNGGSVDGDPDVFVFENYKKGDQKPAIKTIGHARSYVGTDGVMYRVFMDGDAWPVRCMDVLFSRKDPFGTAEGRIYYDRDGHVYARDIGLEKAK